MRRSFLAVLLSCSLFCGCATWPQHGIEIKPGKGTPMVVLPVQWSVKVKKIENIESVPKEQKGPVDEKELEARKERISNSLTAELTEKIAEEPGFNVIPLELAGQSLNYDLAVSTRSLTLNELKLLREKLNIQVILETKITGYGRVKPVWLFYLIGSGFVEGVAQGVIAYQLVKNKWVAIAIGGEEILSESLTWGVGIFLFDRIFTPVILESKLISTFDGKAVWSKTALSISGLGNKELKKLPASEQKKKENRLRVSADKAIKEISDSLRKKIPK